MHIFIYITGAQICVFVVKRIVAIEDLWLVARMLEGSSSTQIQVSIGNVTLVTVISRPAPYTGH